MLYRNSLTSSGTSMADCQLWKAKESRTRRSPWRCQTENDNELKNRPKRRGYEAPGPSKFELPCRKWGPTRLTKSRKLQSFQVARDRKSGKFHIFERSNPGLYPRRGVPKRRVLLPAFVLAPLREPARWSPVGRVFIGPLAATDSGLSFLHRWRKRGRRRRVSPRPSLPRSTLGSSCCPCEYFCRVRQP
jgi:hypothetical protein